MKALNLIIQREYLAAVKTKAFIISTILIPIVMIVVMVLPAILMKLDNDNINKVYVVDSVGKYFNQLKSSDKYEFIKLDSKDNFPDRGSKAAELYGLLTIDAVLSDTPNAVTFFSEKQQPPRELIQYINTVLTDAVKKEKLNYYTEHAKVDTQIVNSLQSIFNSSEQISVNTKQWAKSGQEKDTVSDSASLVGMVLSLLMFFFIMMNGSMVLQSVVEEKTNKIVEVIISSTKPFNLMLGKIIAVALMGLTQLAIWAVVLGIGSVAMQMFGLGISGGEMSAMADGNTQEMMARIQDGSLIAIMQTLDWTKILVCLVVYFIGGYLLFASLYAMFGSAANDSQEAQQFTMPLTILMLLAFYVGFAATRNPEGGLAFWGSFIPFTSPIVMMVRLPLEVPIWQIILSMGILFVTAVACIFFAGKIYRVGVLMTGKKVTVKEIFKWINYK